MSMAFDPILRPNRVDDRSRHELVRLAVSQLTDHHSQFPDFNRLRQVADDFEVLSVTVPDGGIEWRDAGAFLALAYVGIVLHWNADGLFKSAHVKCHISGRIHDGEAEIEDVRIAQGRNGMAMLLP